MTFPRDFTWIAFNDSEVVTFRRYWWHEACHYVTVVFKVQTTVVMSFKHSVYCLLPKYLWYSDHGGHELHSVYCLLPKRTSLIFNLFITIRFIRRISCIERPRHQWRQDQGDDDGSACGEHYSYSAKKVTINKLKEWPKCQPNTMGYI